MSPFHYIAIAVFAAVMTCTLVSARMDDTEPTMGASETVTKMEDPTDLADQPDVDIKSPAVSE
jgi:hypothetical protein